MHGHRNRSEAAGTTEVHANVLQRQAFFYHSEPTLPTASAHRAHRNCIVSICFLSNSTQRNNCLKS